MTRATISMVWVLVLAGMVSTGVDAREINKDLMDRDLRIMEGVLADILNDDDRPAVWGRRGTRVQGTYYDGYGVLFLVEGDMIRHRVHVRARRHDSQDDDSVVTTKVDEPTDQQENRKEKVIDFLGNYAGTIRQLRPNEKISVRLRPGQGGNYSVGLPNAMLGARPGRVHVARNGKPLDLARLDSARFDLDEIRVELDRAKADLSRSIERHVKKMDFDSDPVPGLVATVLKKDVDKHQGTEKLAEIVKFREIEEDSFKGRDIRIFAGILETALESDRGWPDGNHKTTGFYEEGVGCLFFMERDLSARFAWVPDHFNSGLELEEDSRGSYATLRSMLVMAIAEYGATLKRVRKDEHIVVNVKLRGAKGKRDLPSRIVMRVKKEAVERYSQGKMKFQDFQKEIEWQDL